MHTTTPSSQLKAVSQTNEKYEQRLQATPGSYFDKPSYFTNRLIRLKQKIDSIRKLPDVPVESSTYTITDANEEEVSSQMHQSKQINRKQNLKQIIAPEKLTQQVKEQIKSIYNQIRQIQEICSKDQDSYQTSKTQLNTFIRDINAQKKRLLRVLPNTFAFQLQADKKKQYRKSKFKTLSKSQQNKQDKQDNHDQLRQLQEAQKQIDSQFNQNKTSAREEFGDHDGRSCCKCQLI